MEEAKKAGSWDKQPAAVQEACPAGRWDKHLAAVGALRAASSIDKNSCTRRSSDNENVVVFKEGVVHRQPASPEEAPGLHLRDMQAAAVGKAQSCQVGLVSAQVKLLRPW